MKKNVTPRYQQTSIAEGIRYDDFQQILSPYPEDEGVWIHQDAWFHRAVFSDGIRKSYTVKKPGNGVYAFVIKGRAKIGGIVLKERDGLGLWETDGFEIESLGGAEILLMDVPMA